MKKRNNFAACLFSAIFCPLIACANDPVDSTLSSIVVSPASLVADGRTATTVTLLARDVSGKAVRNANVQLTASGGDNVFAVATGVTDANGRFTTTLSSTQVQDEIVVAHLDANVVLGAHVFFVAGAADATASSLVVNPSRQTANNTDTIVATFTLTDALNHPIAGEMPTFSTSGTNTSITAAQATDALGQSSVTLQTARAQEQHVLVTGAGVALATPISFIAGPPSAPQSSLIAGPTSQNADGSSKITLTTYLSDAYDNPIADQSVVFFTTGSAGPLAVSQATTDAHGMLANTLMASYAGANQIFAVAQPITLTASASFTPRTAYCAASPNYINHTLTAGQTPYYVAIADFNGDNLPDLAVVATSDNAVDIFLGAASGNFQARRSYAVGNNPQWVAIGDFNGDANLDLVTANKNDNTVSILTGTGQGDFSMPQSYATGSAPVSVAVGDFNNDGRQDLAVANYNDNTVSVLLGTRTSTFLQQSTYATGLAPLTVALGDFNGDGKQDLVSANSGEPTVSILHGRGNGAFLSHISYTTSNNPYDVAVGDFNGDGRLDLVTINNATVSILLAESATTFATPVTYPINTYSHSVSITDFNGDGHQDLAIGYYYSSLNSISLLAGTGAGTFQAKIDYPVGSQPTRIAAGDFNRDGTQDLAVTNNSSGTVSILLYASCN